MNRFWTYLMDPRVLGVIGLAALAAFVFLGADTLRIGLTYALLLIVLLLVIWLMVWAVRKWLAYRASRKFSDEISADADRATEIAAPKEKANTALLRDRMQDTLKTIKSSKLGQSSGASALYELPWYIIIGNPAAGKSTAVARSGLKFPFANNTDNIIQGIGGTRNCDWFFTTEGILLDTAGRYSVYEEDRQEWLGFLSLLKKHRSKAPINGIIIAASIAELAQARPDAAIQLAKNLRQRVQELTEKLEVFAPVYLMFTKADLIAGFVEFFEDMDPTERERVWGATFAYDPSVKSDAVALFDKHFDELREGLREMALARMSLKRGQTLPPGLLTFPLEFGTTKPALRAFIATLFEDNPYQFQPIFRGMYFTSAAQEGMANSRASTQIAQQFNLSADKYRIPAQLDAANGFFLKDLFSRIIFADKNLVKQYASRAKRQTRTLTFGLGVLLLAGTLGALSWSYLGNRKLMQNVSADLEKVSKLQAEKQDLASRMEALEILQDRIEQLRKWQADKPMAVGLGLYQGDVIERKLSEEYFNGVRQIMLNPVSQAIEGYLGEVNQNAARLQPLSRTPSSAVAALNTPTGAARPANSPSRFIEASTASTEEAYNALKTYLMLSDKQRMESGHMTDQITRFWRGWLDNNRGTMPREIMNRNAERIISFSMANLQDPLFPTLSNNLGMVDQSRESLRKVLTGMPARERVYAEIKARAATRYAPMTVARIVGDSGKDVVAGSYAISGTFSKEAWDGYIKDAFKNASDTETQNKDWVLNTRTSSDLSLEGSPDQIRKSLIEIYKTEYVREWQRFMQGISVNKFDGFESAVTRMNKLGDASESPIKKVMTTLYDQTSWDNPSLLNDRLAGTQKGIIEWFKQTVLRQAPSGLDIKVDINAKPGEIPMGPIGREFSSLARIMMSRDSSPSQMSGYLAALGKVRSKFNQVKNAGDNGPASRQLMAATLEGSSELAEALKFVDEQMLVGVTDTARVTLRPLLVRPLIQSFAVIVAPTEAELNRVWAAQVTDLFQRTLLGKYPFDSVSKVEAGPQEIAKIFSPEGAVSKFATDALGPLIVRRGDAMSPRTWADMGIRLKPEFSNGFATWIAPLEGAAGGGAAGGKGGGASSSQTAFQIYPLGTPSLAEYSIEIDGQTLRYRNGAAVWTDFIYPNPGSTEGAKVTGTTLEGKPVEIFNVPGKFGFDKLIEASSQRKLPDGNELTWSRDGQSVSVKLRIIRTPGAVSNGGQVRSGTASLRGLTLPALIVGSDTPVLMDSAGSPNSATASSAATTGAAK